MSAATILFAGTPDFARVSLRALVEQGYRPAAALTQPDRPAGRGRKMTASPVKTYALSENIPLWQPATLKDPDIVAMIAASRPDLIVVAAYGLILPQAVLDIPKIGCLNVHASLLPRWRGAAPIAQAILNGDAETGVCLMQMEAGLDTGPVYACTATAIGEHESAGELHDRLALMGSELLAGKIAEVLAGNIAALPQDDNDATYAGKIRKTDAAIDWANDATEILRKIRAYNPAPGAFFKLDDERVQCWKAEVLHGVKGGCGVIIKAGKAGVDVACGTNALRFLEVQRPGRRRITGAEFAAQIDLVGKRLA
jgi:methionyl-tRNA formyltransferase